MRMAPARTDTDDRICFRGGQPQHAKETPSETGNGSQTVATGSWLILTTEMRWPKNHLSFEKGRLETRSVSTEQGDCETKSSPEKADGHSGTGLQRANLHFSHPLYCIGRMIRPDCVSLTRPPQRARRGQPVADPNRMT